MFDAIVKKLDRSTLPFGTASLRASAELGRSKTTRRVRNAQRGMTLLEIMIVLAILALVMGLIVGPRVMAMFGESKVKLTDIKVKKFANEAFPQWSMANPSKQCPSGLADLTKYMNDQSPEAVNDAWGKPLKMYCGQAMPPGVSGFAVSSFGENGTDDNGGGDDLASWK